MLLNCGVGEYSREFLDCKETQPVHPKGEQSLVFIGRTDVEAETGILWPPDAKNWLIWGDPDAGNHWRQKEKGMTGWNGWMASVTQWTWVWVDSRSWWWTGRPGMLRFTGSQRVRHDWPTQLNWTQYMLKLLLFCYSKTNTTSVGGRHSWFPFVREVCFLSNCPSCWGFLKLLNIRGAISFFEHSKSKSNHFWKHLRLLWQ